ncbi:MAG: peptidylprolyl isomerase, partial [Actinobacteria bacterium]|nr:peptidylprolyl isomerase [Actinomycetota bacterium]
EDGSSPRTITFAEPHPMCIDTTKSHVAVFDTSEGEIRVTLNTAETPITVNNFVTLARWGYYDGTTIFRSDPSIDIIQGGAPRTESPSDPGPGYTIPDEPQFEETSAGIVGPYRYVPGQLVMARTALPNSSSAQYFFTTGENAARLDGQGVYVVFGESSGSWSSTNGRNGAATAATSKRCTSLAKRPARRIDCGMSRSRCSPAIGRARRPPIPSARPRGPVRIVGSSTYIRPPGASSSWSRR